MENNEKPVVLTIDDVPIIFDSALFILKRERDRAEVSLKKGVMDYPLKPFKPASLVVRAKLRLERRRYRLRLETLPMELNGDMRRRLWI